MVGTPRTSMGSIGVGGAGGSAAGCGGAEPATPGTLADAATHAQLMMLAVYTVVGHGLLLLAITTAYYASFLLQDYSGPILWVRAYAVQKFAMGVASRENSAHMNRTGRHHEGCPFCKCF